MAATAPSLPRSPIGTNVGECADWHTDPPFVNVFKTARPWFGGNWDKWDPADPVSTDARGNLLSVRAGQVVRTIMLTNMLGNFPGTWVLEWDGDGDVHVDGLAKLEQKAGLFRGSVSQTGLGQPAGSLIIAVSRTSEQNLVRNFRVRRLSTIGAGVSGAFAPKYVSRLSIYSGLRFLDMGMVNNHPAYPWADRPVLDDAVWSSHKGVPIEAMIELTNRTGATPWLCVPHTYDDEAVAGYADRVAATLRPGIKRVRVSHSNEIWNGDDETGFAQAAYCRKRGLELGLGGPGKDAVPAAARYHAQRTVEIGRIWRNRLVGVTVEVVLDSAHGELHRHEWMVEHVEKFTGKKVAESVTSLATAPYVGYRFGDHAIRDKNWNVTDPAWGDRVLAMGVDEIVDRLEREDVPDTLRTLEADVKFAKSHGLRHTAYEWSQHLVGVGARKGIAALNAKFAAANRHPRMAKVIVALAEGFRKLGVSCPHHFVHSGAFTEHGCWGSLESAWQNTLNSPKRVALEAVSGWPCWWQ